jgi:hypothetical protein
LTLPRRRRASEHSCLRDRRRQLASYEDGVSQLNQELKDLSHLTADNPAQRETIERLCPLIAGRLRELEGGIAVRKRAGLLAGVAAITRATKGEEWMGLIAVQIAKMRSTEEELLRIGPDKAAANTRKMRVAIVCGNALAILILLAAGVLRISFESTGKCAVTRCPSFRGRGRGFCSERFCYVGLVLEQAIAGIRVHPPQRVLVDAW